MNETGEAKISEPQKPRRKRLRRMFLLYLVVPYLAVTLIFAVLQRKLLYQPTFAEDLRATAVGLDPESVRDIQITTPDGETLNGWLLKGGEQNEEPGPLVLYFPGNSLNRHERIQDLREVANSGYDVVIFDYRSFGDSTGSPSERKLTADAQLIWDFAITELGYKEDRIVIFGESLGGAVALSLWREGVDKPPNPAGVILNSSFASLPETVGGHYPWFPFRFLLLDRWPSKERIPRVRAPVIIFHGTDDRIVPISQGRKLAAASDSAQFIEIPGGVHNEIPMHQLREELKRLHPE